MDLFQESRFAARTTRLLRWTFNRTIEAVSIAILALMFLSGVVADSILANTTGPEDVELPRVAYPIRQSAEFIQIVGGQGEGLNCSLPPGVDFLAFPRSGGLSPISLRMRQACVFHDYCYRHGAATYGYSQADCDYMLQEQAFRLCTQININRRIADCETEARKVTLGVRLGGWGSFKRADAALSEDGSTYFEYDPYPLDSPLYRVVRIADAPDAWRALGADAKAFYIFWVKQSGMELRIVAKSAEGRSLCASLRLAASYEAITTPPLVVRNRKNGRDWLVWWRRHNLSNTEGSFAGIAPATAQLLDWRDVFGHAEEIQEDCYDTPFAEEAIMDVETVGGKETSPKASFADFQPHYELPNEEEREFKQKDTLVSEFIPLFPSDGATRRDQPLVLYGLTTHGCSVPGDNSSCLAEIEIDPDSKEGIAFYEPYVAYDARCISDPGHRLYSDATELRGRETCDRYRNFNHAPFIAIRDGLPELAWVRRGTSTGAGYDSSALLRRAPRRDGELGGPLNNFDTFALDGYSERLEPSAMLGEAGEFLVSVTPGGFPEKSCVELHRTYPRKIDEFRDRIRSRTERTPSCIEGLDRSWLQRPWRMIADGAMLFFRTDLVHVAAAEEDEPERWDVRLDVAVVDPNAERPVARLAATAVVGSIRVCERALRDLRRSDARWVLRTGTCYDYGDTELARGRDETKKILAAARIMRSAPIAVADVDGDAVLDIGVLLPGNGYDITLLRGTDQGSGLIWALRND